MTAQDIWLRLFNLSAGRFFTVQFVKQDGYLRILNGKIPSKVSAKDVDVSGHIVVLDVKKGQYRKVNLKTIQAFRCSEIVI